MIVRLFMLVTELTHGEKCFFISHQLLRYSAAFQSRNPSFPLSHDPAIGTYSEPD
jgi:hypothetical protein